MYFKVNLNAKDIISYNAITNWYE